MGYIDTQLFIDGKWQPPVEGKTMPVVNPATGKEIGRVAHAGRPDLNRALEAAQKGFEGWRDMVPAERSKIMRKAAALMRERAGEIAPLLTQEQGKPPAAGDGGAGAGGRARAAPRAGGGEAARGGEGRDAGGRRHHRMVRRGGLPRLRPHRAL